VVVGALHLPQFSSCFHGIELGIMTWGICIERMGPKEGAMYGFIGSFGANFVSIVVCCNCSNHESGV